MEVSDLKFEQDLIAGKMFCAQSNVFVEKIVVNNKNTTIFVVRDGVDCFNFAANRIVIRNAENVAQHTSWEFVGYNVRHISVPRRPRSDESYLRDMTPIMLAILRDCWGPLRIPVREIKFQESTYRF